MKFFVNGGEKMVDENSEITLNCEVLGSNLKKLRKERKLSREEFANRVGVSSRIIADYEDGFKTPRLETFYKISIVLGVTMDSILH